MNVEQEVIVRNDIVKLLKPLDKTERLGDLLAESLGIIFFVGLLGGFLWVTSKLLPSYGKVPLALCGITAVTLLLIKVVKAGILGPKEQATLEAYVRRFPNNTEERSEADRILAKLDQCRTAADVLRERLGMSKAEEVPTERVELTNRERETSVRNDLVNLLRTLEKTECRAVYLETLNLVLCLAAYFWVFIEFSAVPGNVILLAFLGITVVSGLLFALICASINRPNRQATFEAYLRRFPENTEERLQADKVLARLKEDTGFARSNNCRLGADALSKRLAVKEVMEEQTETADLRMHTGALESMVPDAPSKRPAVKELGVCVSQEGFVK